MKTLVVFFSKTGNTKKVAEELIQKLGCDSAELEYDEKAKKTSGGADPSGYEHVVLLCPIWAFSLAEPMKFYLKEHGKSIQSYSLIVTCGGLGLWGCVKNCVKAIGKQPQHSMKIRSKIVIAGDFDISPVISVAGGEN